MLRFSVQQAVSWDTLDYTVGAVWAALIFVLIATLARTQTTRRTLLAAWSARMLTSLGFALIFEQFYFNNGLDAYGYFYAATDPAFEYSDLSRGLGTQAITILTHVFCTIHFNSYHATKVSFAFIGLMGCHCIYTAIATYHKRDIPLLRWTLHLAPSILFWSSILGKDPIILAGVALFFHGLVKTRQNPSMGSYAAMLSGLTIASTIRIWMAPILLGATFMATTTRGTGSRFALLPWIAKGLTVLAAVWLAYATIALDQGVDLTDTATSLSERFATGGSAREQLYYSTPADMLTFYPIGLFSALFRPLIGEVGNAFGWLAGLENTLLLSALIASLFRLRRYWPLDFGALWTLLLILFWGSIYAFVSHFNLGTAVRYRLPVLPLLIWLISRPYISTVAPHPTPPGLRAHSHSPANTTRPLYSPGANSQRTS